jgi:hypothetical protein
MIFLSPYLLLVAHFCHPPEKVFRMFYNHLPSMKNTPGQDKAGDQIKVASAPGASVAQPPKAPVDVAAGLPKTVMTGESVVSKAS